VAKDTRIGKYGLHIAECNIDTAATALDRGFAGFLLEGLAGTENRRGAKGLYGLDNGINLNFIVFFLVILVNTLIILKDKMLINKSDLVVLKELSISKDLVSLDRIPASFKSDFNKYFFGKTLVQDEHKHLFAYPHDIKQWVQYLFIAYKD